MFRNSLVCLYGNLWLVTHWQLIPYGMVHTFIHLIVSWKCKILFEIWSCFCLFLKHLKISLFSFQFLIIWLIFMNLWQYFRKPSEECSKHRKKASYAFSICETTFEVLTNIHIPLNCIVSNVFGHKIIAPSFVWSYFGRPKYKKKQL